MVGVYNAACAANGETETWTEAALGNDLANLTNIAPTQTTCWPSWADRLVAISEIEWNDTTEGQRHHRSVGFVHPQWRRRGIGTPS